jgi:hypothetical protein
MFRSTKLGRYYPNLVNSGKTGMGKMFPVVVDVLGFSENSG